MTPSGRAARRSPRVQRVAVLDLGTNSLRSLIADCWPDGTYRIVEDEKIPCRIGEGLERTGRLGQEPMDRTLEGLRRAVAMARAKEVHRVQAIATSAVREAVNGQEFRDRVAHELGIELEVVTGTREARLAFLSLRRHFDLTCSPSLALDLGGGSLEVVVAARDDLVEDVFTLPLGAVRLTEAFLPDPTITMKQYRRLRRHAKALLKKHLADYRDQGHRVYASGGAITTLARILLVRRGRPTGEAMGLSIPRSELRHLREILRSLPLEERRRLPGLPADRADIIVASTVVLEEALRVLGAESIVASTRGIREGVLLEIMQEVFPALRRRDVSPLESRHSSVRNFARSCGVEMAHAEHVRGLSLSILDQLGPPPGADPAEAVALLGAAALLHDIGHLVRFQGHHKHSQHLIAHADLDGFTPRRRNMVALIARFHTGPPPPRRHRALAELDKPDRHSVRYLAGVLRLADGLDRCHCQRVTRVLVRHTRNLLTVKVEASSNPELELWAAERKVDLLAKVLGVRSRVEAIKQPLQVL